MIHFPWLTLKLIGKIKIIIISVYGLWYEFRCPLGIGVLLVLSWIVSYLTLVEVCFVGIVNVHVHVYVQHINGHVYIP